MAEATFADQIAVLDSTLKAIETRVSRGQVADETLGDFKSALDDLRLRLWGLLSAAGDDSRGFQDRFRIRRATEMCRGLGSDLGAGSVSAHYPELAGLRDAASELTQNIERAQRHAY
jgi:hypothetical protein